MNRKYIVLVTSLLALFSTAVLMPIQQQKVYACGLDDLTSCFSASASSGGYYAGQQDAQYDHTQGLAYNPTPACCHPDDWDNQFTNGYNAEWNRYQSQNTEQRTNVNINGNNNVVNVGQTSSNDQSQSQGPSVSDTGCGDSGQCGGCNGPCGNPCSGSCGGPCSYSGGPCDFGCGLGFHHFWHEGCGFGCGGYGYRHIGFLGGRGQIHDLLLIFNQRERG